MMKLWENLSANRLLAEASIWSADFTRLEDEIRRVDEYVDLYHFDVSDAHFVPGLLFFPDLVAALRPLTRRPFHVHLMVEDPASLVDDFIQAGADLLTVHMEVGDRAAEALGKIRAAGCGAGLACRLETAPESLLPYLEQIELILMMGTPLGVKGQPLSPLACPRIQCMKSLLREYAGESKLKIVADGGIRTETVPELHKAGADGVVMGSLLFKSDDLPGTFAWLHGLSEEGSAA